VHLFHVLPDAVVGHEFCRTECGVVQFCTEHEEWFAIDDQLARCFRFAEVRNGHCVDFGVQLGGCWNTRRGSLWCWKTRSGKSAVEFNDYGGASRVQHVDSVTCALHLRSNAA
jgi:hypothetical protein